MTATYTQPEATEQGDVIIWVDDITKAFPTPDGSHLVLDGVSLEVRDGEVLALLGKSGSGKSTLLRCIAGLSYPTTGDVTLRGQPVTGPNPSTAMVFQTFALLPWLTVQQNVELGLEARSVASDERAERAARAIDLIGLDGFADAYPRELSGGMRQRVGFARALVTEPDVLLMDEPFSALDVLTAENLRSELIELLASDEFVIRAVVVVTHNIEEAVTLADRVVVLGSNPGKIKAGFPIDLPRPRVRTSDAFIGYLDRIYAILTRGGDSVGGEAGSSESDGRASQESVVDRAGNTSTIGHDRPLPVVTVDGIAGFADIMLAERDRSIANLAADLGLDIDDLFPLVDALELLGFAEVSNGRTHLTEEGARYAQAPIQEAKRQFAQAALAHAQLIRVMVSTLQRSASSRAKGAFFLDMLRRHHNEQHAQLQLVTAIDWGRYAELFEYDDRRDEFTLVAAQVS
ncbi:MAG: NitT/TauT family transport system ATP-binding protein [Actinomycetota bacterium]|nr:NitT/TauT family transport system ATP-binding protein [Actinomycetota bacterium]